MLDAPSNLAELSFLQALSRLTSVLALPRAELRRAAVQAVADHLAGRALREGPFRGHLTRLLTEFSWSADEREAADGFLTPHLLETLFAGTLVSEEKRVGGIVYTSRLTADAVIDATLPLLPSTDGPLAIADPATGSGAFLIALALRFPGARLHGFDPSSPALAIARQRLALCRQALGSPRDDHLVAGTAQDLLLTSGPYDLVIGNPPYVRHEARNAPPEALLPSLAHCLSCSATDRRLQQLLLGRADLYATFFVMGLAAVRPGGVVAFVTADSWLDARFGLPLQALLLEHCDRLDIIPETTRSFGATGINTVITVARRRAGLAPTKVRFGSHSPAQPPYPGKWAARYLRGGDITRRLQKHPAMVPLAGVANISYGTKPGIRPFFVLPREASPDLVDKEFVKPCLASSKDILNYAFAAHEVRHDLFICPYSQADLTRLGFLRTAEYVTAGSTKMTLPGARHTLAGIPYPQVPSVASNRPEWHCLTPRTPGQFVVPCLFGSRLFVAHNCCSAYDTNAFFHGSFQDGVDWRVGLGLLNGSTTYLMFEAFGRPKGLGGLNLFGPELKQLPIPDPRVLEEGLKIAIANAFTRLCQRPIMSLRLEVGEGILQQVPADRRELDGLICQALGWTEMEQEACYRELYNWSLRRLEKGRSR